MEFGAELEGERRVALRFQQFPEFARQKFIEVVTDFQGRLQSAIEARLPRGKTGAIAAALAGGVDSSKYRVRGWVSLAGGDRLKVILPAIALEYGSNSSIKVKEKSGRLLKTVYGRYVTPRLVNVSAYNRTTDIAAQRFLRDPLNALAEPAIAALSAALDAAVQES